MIKDIWEESTWKDALADIAVENKMRETAKKVIALSFGSLSDEIATAIDKADEALCEDIVIHTKTDSLEQVRQRLGLV